MITKDTLITAEWLREMKACDYQVDIFKRHFPSGTKITRHLCVKHCVEFSVDWLAKKALSTDSLYNFFSKRRMLDHEYGAKIIAIYDEYLADPDPIDEEHCAKEALIFWGIFSKQEA
jgi:hypothetical protein